MQKVLRIENLDCPVCAEALQSDILKIKGVHSARVDYVTQTISLDVEEETVIAKVIKVANNFEEVRVLDGGRYEVKLLFEEPTDSEHVGKVLRADWEKLPKDAVFRFRKAGDEIEKFGGGVQTLKKFFNDKKIPVKERGYFPLIAQTSGNCVYAVCGEEIADFIKVTKTTQRVVYIILQKK